MKTFKDLVKNLEIIKEYMRKLRKKGNCLPIKIIVESKGIEKKDKAINYDITYKLKNVETNFKEIKDYL